MSKQRILFNKLSKRKRIESKRVWSILRRGEDTRSPWERNFHLWPMSRQKLQRIFIVEVMLCGCSAVLRAYSPHDWISLRSPKMIETPCTCEKKKEVEERTDEVYRTCNLPTRFMYPRKCGVQFINTTFFILLTSYMILIIQLDRISTTDRSINACITYFFFLSFLSFARTFYTVGRIGSQIDFACKLYTTRNSSYITKTITFCY